MGSKPSNNFQSDRPESGGADKDMEHEKSGLLERDKEKFAIEQQARHDAAHRDHEVHRSPYTFENPPPKAPEKK